MIGRLKKAWLSERDSDRQFAILYADGKVYTGYTHAECAEQYKQEANSHDIKNGAFAYMGNDNNIYLADDFLYGYTKSDLPQIAQDLKQKYPNSNIYYDSTSHFDTKLDDQHEQVARLKRVAEDSCNVPPNGVIWNDDIWDTYDESLIKNQKSNINREWLFEEPITNQEWNLQEN
jgi:UDP-N-acetyl-D-mannosaminuronic acid transferase (WecB/TagA/CpsF family)